MEKSPTAELSILGVENVQLQAYEKQKPWYVKAEEERIEQPQFLRVEQVQLQAYEKQGPWFVKAEEELIEELSILGVEQVQLKPFEKQGQWYVKAEDKLIEEPQVPRIVRDIPVVTLAERKRQIEDELGCPDYFAELTKETRRLKKLKKQLAWELLK